MIKKIDEIIDRTLKQIKKRKGDDRYFKVLLEIAGSEWDEQMKFLNYERGTLSVGVVSSSVLQEITQFYKYEWLKKMQSEQLKIKEIKVHLIDNLGD